jgi:LacI family transcriptional regulator
MAAKLADVARRAGVSTATASRILNKKMVMPIPQATIERIENAAKDLGYRPNAFARALVTRKTYTLGLFTQEMTDPHFAQMLEAVEAKARALGYRVVVSGDLESLAEGGLVDGIILLADAGDPQFATRVWDKPCVYVWHKTYLMPDCISWSDFEGTRLCGQYLLELGHRHIVALFGNYTPSEPAFPKVAGFRSAMQGLEGISYRELQGELSADQFENGYLLIRQFLHKTRDFTALFARNDFLALGAMKALRESGLAIPHDISIVGYADTALARCADPALTSARTPIAEAGAAAVEQLVAPEEFVRAIGGRESEFPGRMLRTSLTLRDSCAPPRSL